MRESERGEGERERGVVLCFPVLMTRGITSERDWTSLRRKLASNAVVGIQTQNKNNQTTPTHTYIQAHRHTGTQVHRHTSTPAHRHTVRQTHRVAELASSPSVSFSH